MQRGPARALKKAISDAQSEKILFSALSYMWNEAAKKQVWDVSEKIADKIIYENAVALLINFIWENGNDYPLKAQDVLSLSSSPKFKQKLIDSISYGNYHQQDIMGVRECAERYQRYSHHMAYFLENILDFDRASAKQLSVSFVNSDVEINNIYSLLKTEARQLLQEITRLTQRLNISADRALKIHLNTPISSLSALIYPYLLSTKMKKKIDKFSTHWQAKNTVLAEFDNRVANLDLQAKKSKEICYGFYNVSLSHEKAVAALRLEDSLNDAPGNFSTPLLALSNIREAYMESCYDKVPNYILANQLIKKPLQTIKTFIHHTFFYSNSRENDNTAELSSTKQKPAKQKTYLQTLMDYMQNVSEFKIEDKIGEYLVIAAIVSQTPIINETIQNLAANSSGLLLGR